ASLARRTPRFGHAGAGCLLEPDRGAGLLPLPLYDAMGPGRRCVPLVAPDPFRPAEPRRLVAVSDLAGDPDAARAPERTALRRGCARGLAVDPCRLHDHPPRRRELPRCLLLLEHCRARRRDGPPG